MGFEITGFLLWGFALFPPGGFRYDPAPQTLMS